MKKRAKSGRGEKNEGKPKRRVGRGGIDTLLHMDLMKTTVLSHGRNKRTWSRATIKERKGLQNRNAASSR